MEHDPAMPYLGPDDTPSSPSAPPPPRHGIVLLARTWLPADEAWDAPLEQLAIADLERARLLDLLPAVLGVADAAVAVAADPLSAEALRPIVPTGVGLAVAPPPALGVVALAAWSIRRLLARGAERVLLLRETALPLPPRGLASALALLADADLVLGPTPSGDTFLLGARDPTGAACLASLAGPHAAALEQAAVEDGLRLSRLEPRRTINPGRGLASLAADVDRLGDLAPNLRRWLAVHRPPGDADPTP